MAEAPDLSDYRVVELAAFNDLLKLAVNVGRQIIYCQDGETANFGLIADGCVYCFSFRRASNY